MKKNKKILYFMIPLILLVWGVVFSQLYSFFFAKPITVVQEPESIINIDEIKEETFSIIADYRDPFLGNKVRVSRSRSVSVSTGTSRQQSNSQRGQNTSRKVESIQQPWPSILYMGMIKNKDNLDRKVIFVKIDNKEYKVKEGDVVNFVTINEINKEFIKVSFQKETKTITK